MRKQIVVILIYCLAFSSGCNKSEHLASPPTGKNQGSATPQRGEVATFDACTLITGQEIEAIEGSPLKETKPSGRSDNGFRFSQCFYT